jgi:hypothetical protein
MPAVVANDGAEDTAIFPSAQKGVHDLLEAQSIGNDIRTMER